MDAALHPRLGRIAGWTLAALAIFFAVFVLPFRFPLREPVLSDTWTAGANNFVAAIGLCVVSVAVALVCFLRTAPEPALASTEPLPRTFLWYGIAAAIGWTALLGVPVARAHIYWGDAGYFLNQLRTGLVFHQPLYTGFEFPYGPALFWWPAVLLRTLAPLGISTAAAYLISLGILQAAGLALLFCTVDALPMRRSLKAAGFILITFGTLTSLLGLNYSIFRFVLPLAAMVLLSRQTTVARAAAIAAAAEVVLLATSPELGIAFAAAASAYALYRSVRGAASWLVLVPATFTGAALFLAVEGRAYFLTLGKMARGGFNLLLSPTAPHLLAFLFAVAVLAPIALARTLRRRDSDPAQAGMIVGFYVVALGLVPAALGRCDPIHVFFNGIAAYLLSLLALNDARPRTRTLWITAVALVFVLTQARNFQLYQYRLEMVLGVVPLAQLEGIDEARLLAAIGSNRISAPLRAPPLIVDELTRRGLYVPGFFSGWTGVWDAASEQRVIADMRRTPFALVALPDPRAPDPVQLRRIAFLRRIAHAPGLPRPEFIRGALLAQELRQHWESLGIYGDYALFRQR